MYVCIYMVQVVELFNALIVYIPSIMRDMCCCAWMMKVNQRVCKDSKSMNQGIHSNNNA